MDDQNSNKDSIASRLALARKYAGLSQGQVAKMLKLHRPSISEIEAGRRKVSAEELSKLAGIYDVSLDWLTSKDSEQDSQSKDKIQLAARELAKLKDNDINKILQLLSALRSKEDPNQ
jgi:transcriptional regulator with XRE-family HTH domain